MYEPASSGPGWLWRFPLFVAGLALVAAILLLLSGYGFLIGTGEAGQPWVACRYLTIGGVTESEEARAVGCRFLGSPGHMSGRQGYGFIV